MELGRISIKIICTLSFSAQYTTGDPNTLHKYAYHLSSNRSDPTTGWVLSGRNKIYKMRTQIKIGIKCGARRIKAASCHNRKVMVSIAFTYIYFEKSPRAMVLGNVHDHVSSLTIYSPVEYCHEKGIILFHSGNSFTWALHQVPMTMAGAPAEINLSNKLQR